MKEHEEVWVKTGYDVFSLLGKNGLKVEQLAQKVGISKSSFYHRFADIGVFEEHLFDFHLRQAKIMAEKEKAVSCINPQLINILIEHKTDLLFNRQLRFNQHDKRYKEILEKSNQVIGNELIVVWVNDLKVSYTHQQLAGIFELAVENFFLQINAENLNFKWLEQYFGNLKRIVRRLS